MENQGKGLLFILILIGVFFLIMWLRRKFKVLNLPCVFFVSGEVKSGKSLLSVHLANKEYKRALRRYSIAKYLTMIFRPMKYKDTFAIVDKMIKEGIDFYICDDNELKDYFPPMLYSNIALACVKYNPLTIDIVERKVRIPNKSVVLIDEVSLFADSQLFKNRDLNNKLMAFYKLYGHYSHGGKMIVDSQSIADNHYSMKRCMGKYLYIYDKVKLPLITIMRVRELLYSEDNSIQNNFVEDIELSLRRVVIFNRTYNKYDCYAYSSYSDYLPCKVCYTTEKKSIKDDLKSYHIVTLNEFVKELNESIKGKYPRTAKSLNDTLFEGDYFVNKEGIIDRYKEVKQNENIKKS